MKNTATASVETIETNAPNINCMECGELISSPHGLKFFCAHCLSKRRKQGIYSYKKKCPICNETFYTNYRMQETCSSTECKMKYSRQTQRETHCLTKEQKKQRKIQRELLIGPPGNFKKPNGHTRNLDRGLARNKKKARRCQFKIDLEGKECGEPVAHGNRFLCRKHFNMATEYENVSSVS